jgi:RNA polymerase sigma-70 factor (ECF subfamily)
MDRPLETFNAHRPRLLGIAYRMLGSRATAEDVLQEAYIRWHQTERAEVRSPEAWLITSVTRLCIDQLRAARKEREAYTGPWLPEPVVSREVPSPEGIMETASDVSIAFLTVLERLAPEERSAFLLREVFDFEYTEVAQMLGKSEATCRQIVHRAKERVREGRPRFQVSRQAHMRLLEKFIAAASTGDRQQLEVLFAEDATFTSDGGGKVIATLKVLHGAERIARLFYALAGWLGSRASLHIAEVNGEPGLLRYVDGKLDSVLSLVTDGVHILDVYTMRNPDKLKGLR